MKNILCLLIPILLLSACEREKQIAPAFNLAGTTWTKLDSHTPGNRPVFKVISFGSDGIVKVAYRYEKKDLMTDVGEFTYLYDYPNFWIKNPDNTLAQGRIYDEQIELGGEILTLQK